VKGKIKETGGERGRNTAFECRSENMLKNWAFFTAVQVLIKIFGTFQKKW
jgi:hypothetical protein